MQRQPVCEVCGKAAFWEARDTGIATLSDEYGQVVQYWDEIRISHYCHKHRNDEWHENMKIVEGADGWQV